MRRSLKWAVLVAGTASALAVGFIGGRALAGGIPSKSALTYSGVLQKPDGSPLTSTGHNLEIKLWSTGPAGGTMLRDTAVPATTFTLDNSGRFSVQLEDACTGAIGANAGAFVDVLLDGNSLGRTQLAAVPYAIEANHAVSADSATTAATANTAGGALATQISQLQGQVHAASGFHAWLTKATSADATYAQVAFDNVEFDLAGEYNAMTGAFTAGQAGTYLIFCAIEYPSPTAGYVYQAAIFRWSTRIGLTEIGASSTSGITPQHTTIVHLGKGDSVTCRSAQFSGSPQPIYFASQLTQFGAVRVY